ncbi:N-acetylneuraminic acid outer membrane channel protein [Buttiauxella gaviniae ATCC 51604]|uniref:N-acetylneuraminic acid outer membrane channel protein n=1 Tax=Buttiauxella gaviniae ATCC 51604 TaxID=1354253 RepID=A0A1B7HQX0_9ENTR|nr:oligogalacturonate-specific porin KdgM family protein [Buttiauxella gaviniae]OAT18033.1 N-acetylneuraminic acid outer membrane channel protein [Buttiauxella gaviniae ATCC 51604]
MKSLFKLSACATLLISVSSNAVTLDYRHEYKPESGTNADRIKIGHTTQDGYFASVEGRVSEKTETDSEGFKNGIEKYSGSGSEFEFGKNFIINEKLTLAPAINLDVGDSYIAYRAQIKANYQINDNWLTTLRWRPGIEVNENQSVKNKNYNQFNWEFGYANDQFSIIGDLEYRLTNYDDYEGDHNYWLYNVVASYNIDKHWKPYTEIGYVPRYNEDHEKDEMEVRYRMGIKYTF